MGQKANPNSLRLGTNKTWSTQFYEKKPSELSDRVFVDQEVRGYLSRFAQVNGLYLYDYKVQYSNSVINIFLVYFITKQVLFSNLKSVHDIEFLNRDLRTIPVRLLERSNSEIPNPSLVEDGSELSSFKFKGKFSQLFTYINHYFRNRKNSKRMLGTNFDTQINRYLTESSNVFFQLSQGLNRFFKGKYNFVITTHCINRDFNLSPKQINTLKKKLLLMQRFKNLHFFSEGFNVCFTTLIQPKGASLLTAFISIQLKTIKRHKPLLRFLRRFFNIFLNEDFSNIKGIKITIKGRLNGAPRAKHKTIEVGNVPTQTINSNLDYCQSTIQNLNGSYGIKVWIAEK